MTVAQFVPACFVKSTGKIPTFASGSSKWLKILAIANIYIDQWMDEPGIDWNSLYQPDFSLGTIGATNTVDLDSDIRKLSQQEGDVIRILHTDGVTYTDYDTINYDRSKDFANKMRTFQDNYITEINRTIYFNRAFTSADPQYGGTIYVPALLYAPHLVNDTDLVPVDIPNWLVFATAAEYIRTDVTRQPQYGNIIQEANQIMQVMKANNEGQNTRIYQPWNPSVGTFGESAWN